jgi:hypothetical protein
MHWVPRDLALRNDGVWRANLLGGGRVLGFVDRLKKLRTLGQYAEAKGWDFGEGFIEGQKSVSRPAEHIIGKPLLPSEALTLDGIKVSAITIAPKKPIEGPRSEKRFTHPMLLVREQMDLPHAVWANHYLTYKNQIVGFSASKAQREDLDKADRWLTAEAAALRAYVASTSVKLFTQKATTLSGADILALPYPKEETLDLSANERILVDDIVRYQRDLIRLGDESEAMTNDGKSALAEFSRTFLGQVNAIYKKQPLRALLPQIWPGIICQPFTFGEGKVEWTGAEDLRGMLDKLLHEQRGRTLRVTRIARIYDRTLIFLLKPSQLRYWLRSVALRDADETLSDLRAQGF